MHYKGYVNPNIWNEEYKFLEYFSQEFNCPQTLEHWNQQYGEIHNIGEMADYRCKLPGWTENIVKEFDLELCGVCFYRMNPGNILPFHRDTYKNYIKFNKIKKPETIWRAIIFLEDWQPGHIFEIDNDVITQYKKGTYVIWNYDAEHMAVNLGTAPRYTLQITGIKNV